MSKPQYGEHRERPVTTRVPSEGKSYVNRLPKPDPDMSSYADEYLERLDQLPIYRPTVGCVIPTYNEESSIGEVLESLLEQTRLPDVIHVIVNNTTDNTIDAAAKYSGVHSKVVNGEEQFCEVYVHDIGDNPDKKVGALNYGYHLVEGMDYLLGVDGDTTADPKAIEYLVDEISNDKRIGGVSAIYGIDEKPIRGLIPRFLIMGQRAQFAAFNMQNLLRGRSMAVLGGQFSIFSMKALADVMAQTRQNSPWVKDSEIEDSLLSLEIKSAGYLTKISAESRADVGGMTTLRSLDAQQVKWNYGAIDLMWPGQRGDTRGQPWHPNLRLRWYEHFSMAINALSRLMLLTLFLFASSVDAFVFLPVWLIPPAVATLLNLKVAFSIRSDKRTMGDVLFALLFFPAELYMWVRIGHFIRSWARFFSNRKTDNWAAQAKAERGTGGNSWVTPFLVLPVIIAVLYLIWLQFPLGVQSQVLSIGWGILGLIVILQTVVMVFKLLKPNRGFTV